MVILLSARFSQYRITTFKSTHITTPSKSFQKASKQREETVGAGRDGTCHKACDGREAREREGHEATI